MWLDRRPNSGVKIKSVTPISSEANPPYKTTAQIATWLPHFLRKGDWLQLGSIVANGTTENSYNNYVEVTEVEDRKSFKVLLPGNLNVGALGAEIIQNEVLIGTNFQAITNHGGYGGGSFSNRIVSANRGLYHDFWWGKHSMFRKNYLYNVFRGADYPFSAGISYNNPESPIAAGFTLGVVSDISLEGVVKVELSTANADPGFQPGVALQIFKQNTANMVTVTVLRVSFQPGGVFSFEFQNPVSLPFQDEDAVQFYLWFQQTFFLFEDNIIELQKSPAGLVSNAPAGVYLRGPEWSAQAPDYNPFRLTYKSGLENAWTFRFVSLRDNSIRKIGDQLDPDALTYSWGIRADTVQNLIAEGNVIGRLNNVINQYLEPQVLAYGVTDLKKAFNNQHPGGKLRQLFNDPSWKDNNAYWLDEIATLAEDWVWVGDAKKMIF